MSIDVGSAVGYLDLDVSGFMTGLKTAQSEASTSSKKIVNVVEGNMKKVGSSMTSAGTMMTTAVTAPILAAGAASFTFAADFESAMAKVDTIADSTQKSLKTIQDEIVDLSNETGTMASDLAESTYQAISAGVDTASSVEFVAQASKLATAGFTDTTAAVDVLTTVINAYGLEAEDATHIADVLISTQNKGKTTVDELASSIGKIIPTANAMNVSIEDLGTMYAYTTSQGIATAEATTYLNGMLNELGKSGTDVSDILEDKTGKSFSELTKEGKSVRDILELIEEEAVANDVAFTDLWGSQEAAKAALSLLNAETEDYKETLDDFTNTQGDVESAFNKMADTTNYKLKVALENGRNASIDLGNSLINTLLPYIEQGVDFIEDLTEKFNELSDEEKQQIIEIVGLVAVVGPALILIGQISSAIGSVIGVVKTVTTLTSGLFTLIAANPIGAVITVIGLLVGALILWQQHTEAVTAAEKLNIEEINRVSEAAFANKDAIDKLNESYQTNVDMINDNAGTKIAELELSKELVAEYQNLFDANGKLIEGNELRAQSLESRLSPVLGIDLQAQRDLVTEYLNLFDANGNIITGNEERATQIETVLSEVFGIEVDGINDVIEANTNLIESIDEVIIQEQARIALAAYSEMVTQAIQREEEAKRQMANASTELTEIERELNTVADGVIGTLYDSVDSYASYVESARGAYNMDEKTREQALKLIDAYRDQQESVVEAGEIMMESEDIRARHTAANTAFLEGNYEQVTSSFQLSADQQKIIASGSTADLEAEIGRLSAEIVLLYDKRNKAQSEAEKVFWNSQIKETKTQGQAMVDEYENLGGDTSAAFMDNFKETSSDFQIITDSISLDGLSGLEDNTYKFGNEGENQGLGYVNGIKAYKSDSYWAAYDNAMAAIQGTRDAQNSASPAKELIKEGGYFGQGYVIGIEDEFDNAQKVGKELVMSALSEVSDADKEFLANADNSILFGSNKSKSVNRSNNDEFIQSNDSNQGDTYIFNSPKVIDETEAAKQMKKVKRDLAEGF